MPLIIRRVKADGTSEIIDPNNIGIGTAIKKVTGALGIPQCGGCKKRQAWLDANIPVRYVRKPR